MKKIEKISSQIEGDILRSLRRSIWTPPHCKSHLENIILRRYIDWQISRNGKYWCKEGFDFVGEIRKEFNKSLLRLTKAGIILRCSKYPYTIKLNI